MAERANFPASPIGNAATAGLLVTYFLVALWGAQVLGSRLAPTTLIWPAAGVGLALVLLRGIGVWPLIFAAAAARLAITADAGTWSVVAGSTLVNGAAAALEPVLAAWLIWRVAGENFLERAGPFILAMVVAAPIAALISALPLIVGAVSADLVTTYSTLGWLATWHTTAVSDAIGLLVLTPPIFIWMRRPPLRLERRHVFELLALGGVAALVLAVPDPGEPHYVLLGAHLAIALRVPLQWNAAAVGLSSCLYLSQALETLSPPAVYESFLSEITFVAALNLATYLAALLHSEEVRHLERREALLRDREHLLRELGKAEQGERQRIAAILHDNLQQLLVAAKMALSPSDRESRIHSLIDEAIEAARDLTMELHPPVLDERGLAAALYWLGQRFQELHGLEVRVEADEAAEPSDSETRYYLFQVARGLLMNVVKHAETDTAWLRLRRAENWLTLEVEDRGKGCDPAQFEQPESGQQGYGLFAMRQRVGLLGGHMRVSAENGCRITLSVPLSAGSGTAPGDL